MESRPGCEWAGVGGVRARAGRPVDRPAGADGGDVFPVPTGSVGEPGRLAAAWAAGAGVAR